MVKMTRTVRLAKIFKALSHPKRLELYFKIAEQDDTAFEASCECFVTEMIQALKLGAPTISHHIKELENANLIETERRGKYLHVKVNKSTFEEIKQISIT